MPDDIIIPVNSGNADVMKKMISDLTKESDERRMKYFSEKDAYKYMLESENYNRLLEIYFKILSIEELNTELIKEGNNGERSNDPEEILE